ncbi:MAG: shikimate dehydrogenase [Halothiobacillaceae bacterium]|nr:shikimate dehydrogenase [Halothiobacillaceae bacterium]HER35725.1 shikimate dehydrogenase [Halothiobacillaceae bacterium]
MTPSYAVIGNPIEHSRSPLIHRAFARQLGIELIYDRLWAPIDGFAEAVAAFREHGGRGMNVTVPFKLEAYDLAEQRSERADRALAANTLVFPDSTSDPVLADNTDGVGLINDLAFHGVTLTGSRVLILGAGGATRGVLAPLLDQGPQEILIANRNPDRAYGLVEEFNDTAGACRLHGCPLEGIEDTRFDVVINATPASLSAQLPPLPDTLIGDRTLAYDMAYGPGPTVFMSWAEARGAVRTLDGMGMLVEQAAESFLLWHGQRPDTAPVRNLLRDDIRRTTEAADTD